MKLKSRSRENRKLCRCRTKQECRHHRHSSIASLASDFSRDTCSAAAAAERVSCMFDSRFLAEIRFRLGRMVLDSFLATQYMRVRETYQHVRYIDRCDMVVDGFPRSANTYAWYAIRTAIEPMYMVRGHTHSVATIRAAIRAGKPAMLLVRDPDSSVASYYQMLNGVSLKACYDAYSNFHERCVPIKDDLYLAKFEDVVADLGSVLEEFYINFGLDWPKYVKSATSERLVTEVIDFASRRKNGGVVREEAVARPSSSRRPATEILADLSSEEEASRRRALSVYSRLVN